MTRVFLVKAVLGAGSKMIGLPGQEPIGGYYQRLGVRAQTIEEAEELVRKYVSADLGAAILEIDDEGELGADGAHSNIPAGPRDNVFAGIWYVGGRAFYRKKNS